MTSFINKSEEIHMDDMSRIKGDKKIAKDIVHNDILGAKINNIKYNEFKEQYRPVGDDTYIKRLWESIDSYSYDDWIVILLDNES